MSEQRMSEHPQSWAALAWQMKWWWMIPMGIIAVLFALLVLFADATGDAPFIYQIF
jgi:uncharacterized membrane protein HdeD (DUF308 family)